MNPTILNREFKHPSDGWYMIEPAGEHKNDPSAVIQVLDQEAIVHIVNRFNADADASQLSHGAEMLVDHEHFRHDQDKESRAYGWLSRLQARADGIYGQIRWSKTGKDAVDGGDYRFFSTEYDPADVAILNTAGKLKRVRPMRLDGLTLTNTPNNKGGRPITNRGNESRREPGGSLADKQENQNQRTMMKSVATKLGLSAEASEETILAEVSKFMNRATDAEGKIAPLQQRVTDLESANSTLLIEQIDADFATAGIKDEKIINRHKPILSDTKHFKTRQERVDFIADLAKPAAGEQPTSQGNQMKLHNRNTKPPGQGGGSDDKAAERARATKIQNRACELQKQTPSLSLATAYSMAQREIES